MNNITKGSSAPTLAWIFPFTSYLVLFIALRIQFNRKKKQKAMKVTTTQIVTKHMQNVPL